jgi:hypothetical protein
MSEKPSFKAIITVEDSSFVTGVQYDHVKFIMDVQFATNRIYRYKNVTPTEFAMFITSKSIGTTYNAIIKGRKTCTKLRRAELVS